MVQPTKDQERWGAAVGLLSLDSVEPFYAYMGLSLKDDQDFKAVIRSCILLNRQTFQNDPLKIPDLKKLVLIESQKNISPDFSHSLESWVYDTFCFESADFLPFLLWHYLFGLSRHDDKRWNNIGVPERIAEITREKVMGLWDLNEFHAIADEIDAHPLSEWDVEMYSLHEYDDEDHDPYNQVLETIKKYRFSTFFYELMNAMNSNEKNHFLKKARELQNRIESLRTSPPLVFP